MTNKVHPNASYKGYTDLRVSVPRQACLKPSNDDKLECTSTSGKGEASIALTVWKKSLLLNCKGFTVYDGTGNIVFRVDNYVTASRGEIVLMDCDGKPLLTLRRKRLSWGDNWRLYEGESSINPKYLVQKQGNLLVNGKNNNTSLAQVQQVVDSVTKRSKVNYNNRDESRNYHIEGSYARRSVVMYNNKRQCVAEIKRKEAPSYGVALGEDVFKLIIVRPCDIDCAMAMALVILLDQMFGSS